MNNRDSRSTSLIQSAEFGMRETREHNKISGVKVEKSIRWMPWRVAAMKDVVNCEKPWGVVNRR